MAKKPKILKNKCKLCLLDPWRRIQNFNWSVIFDSSI